MCESTVFLVCSLQDILYIFWPLVAVQSNEERYDDLIMRNNMMLTSKSGV